MTAGDMSAFAGYKPRKDTKQLENGEIGYFPAGLGFIVYIMRQQAC